MEVLNKFFRKKKLKVKSISSEVVNPDSIIDKNNLALIFEENEMGKVKKYSFVRKNTNGTFTLLNNGEITDNQDCLCGTTKIRWITHDSRSAYTSYNIDDIFEEYFIGNLVYFRLYRNFSTHEKLLYCYGKGKKECLMPCLLSLPEYTSTCTGIFIDKKGIFNKKKRDVKIRDLLDFENHLNEIMFCTTTRYPKKYEKEILAHRKEIIDKRKYMNDYIITNLKRDEVIDQVL